MAYSSWSTSEFTVGYPITSTFIGKFVNNINSLKHTMTLSHDRGLAVPNGNFLLWTDDKPDLWDCSTLEGGYVGQTTVSYMGSYGVVISHDGTTRSGGSIQSEYIPITTVGNSIIQAWTYITGDGNEAQMFIHYYNATYGLMHSSKIATNSAYTTASWDSLYDTAIVLYAGVKWIKLSIQNSTAAGATKAGDINIGMVRLIAI